MENMTNEMVKVDAMEDIMEATTANSGSGLKTAAMVGGIGTLAILGWEFAVKPLSRKVGKTLKEKQVARKLKKAKPIDPDDVDLDDIPEID